MPYCAVQLHRSSIRWFCISNGKEHSRNSWRRVWKDKALWVPTVFTSGKDAPCIFPGLQSQLKVTFPRFLKNTILITKQMNILWVECKCLLLAFKRWNIRFLRNVLFLPQGEVSTFRGFRAPGIRIQVELISRRIWGQKWQPRLPHLEGWLKNEGLVHVVSL